jgi:K+-transporting ATPase ATPase A chain
MVNDRRQGLAILIAMLIIFIPLQFCSLLFEQTGNPIFQSLGVDQQGQPGLAPGGNMEGKEVRFGIVNSVLWATATTATSNGSVNAMLDSFMPLTGMIALLFMHLGEVVFGGVGSGLYSMLLFVILTVFVAGLMVGRTPEYLGKKIEAFEMKMASFAVLVMPMIVLLVTAVAVLSKMGVEAIFNPGTHGFSEILYAFTSMANNNGSAFAGLSANSPFYNIVGGSVMLIGRYWLAIPVLAMAGSLVKKKYVPITAGTLRSHSPLFVILLVCIILIIGALSFFPVLVLGPVVEHLQLWDNYGK